MKASLLIACLLLSACASNSAPIETREPAARTLDGAPLYAPRFSAAELDRLQRQTARALGRLRAEPESEEAWIWYGRRLAYESRFEEALQTYSEGLNRFPDSSRLLRHRSHRLISTRRFRAALLDLARAAELIQLTPDSIEEDGAPNQYGVPRSTQHSNVYYHLALTHYLIGEYAEAERTYLAAQSVSAVNDDLLVAFNWWHWITTRRMLTRMAARVPDLDTSFWKSRLDDLLAPITDSLNVYENHAYHRLLLMARGELSPEELLPDDFSDTQAATLAYGVAAYYLAEGRSQEGYALCRKIVARTPWAAFGHIAAEAELAHKAAREDFESQHRH
ncbi:MAG: hypothetical protein DHS20C15_18970 [Planctomycetota bacterium]|nr:MAG: hypothetical protein DHS20C15_18970 [Planctomycetota bacterium]